MSGFSFRKWWDDFRGAGDASVTIPSMDGALRPNNLLERAETLFAAEGVSNLTRAGDEVFFSSGRDVYSLSSTAPAPKLISSHSAVISALAAHADGTQVIGLSGKGMLIRRPGQSDTSIREVGGQPLGCPTAFAIVDANTLIVCNGSASNPPEHWRRDLMERNRSGSVWRIDLSSGSAECLADGLGYPAGVIVSASGRVTVAESWQSRLISVDGTKTREVILEDLPGYPGSISRSDDGGFWLSVFAPRRQMIEFVLREDAYRKRMMATLPEAFWVAPALRSGDSYLEPVQSGGVRQLGILKPWAPTRSYGLLVELDEDFNPKASFHSRADGRRHGITSAVEFEDKVLATSTGAGQLLAIDPTLSED